MSHSGQELLDSDYAYKRAHNGRSLRAAYTWYIGTSPIIAPRDYAACRQYLETLKRARTVCAPLTSSEHYRLTQLIRKWTRRARGLDPRFNVVGTRPGALTNTERERLLKLGWVPTTFTKPPVPSVPSTPLDKKKCLGCSALFTPTRRNQKFHTTYCKTNYWNKPTSL